MTVLFFYQSNTNIGDILTLEMDNVFSDRLDRVYVFYKRKIVAIYN